MSRTVHGSPDLPGVHVDGYDAELREEDAGFVGDRASDRALHGLLDTLRERRAVRAGRAGAGEGAAPHSPRRHRLPRPDPPDGTIERGGQNLPGNWEEPGFNLPCQVASAMRGDWHVLMHNDAVVQGLSEVHRMRGVRRWDVVAAGTRLGNARFTNI